MGVPISGFSLEILRHVSILTKPGMRMPLQVLVGMKRPVVQETGFDAAGKAFGVASVKPLTVRFLLPSIEGIGSKGNGFSMKSIENSV